MIRTFSALGDLAPAEILESTMTGGRCSSTRTWRSADSGIIRWTKRMGPPLCVSGSLWTLIGPSEYPDAGVQARREVR